MHCCSRVDLEARSFMTEFVHAKYHDGVLTLVLPKVAEVQHYENEINID